MCNGIGLSAPLGVKLLIYAREHVHITDLLPGQKGFCKSCPAYVKENCINTPCFSAPSHRQLFPTVRMSIIASTS